ncbi:MAG TPA: diguanylate cyclase, partial [Rhodocyclaceae bacterium]|nr:diguanylate cyclase [Rhodocyclaceae bacterium]
DSVEAGVSNRRYSLWLASSLIVILAIGWYATEQLGKNAESSVRDRSAGATEILASHLRDEMARTDLMAALLAKSPHVQGGLERRDADSLTAAQTAMRQHTAVLESSIAFLMAPNGNVLVATDEAGAVHRQGENFGFLPYFQDSAAYGLVGKDLAVEPDLEQRGYYVSHPVNNALGQPLGIAVVKKVLAQTDKEFKRFRDWFLVSPQGIIFLSSRPDLLLQPLGPISENRRQQLVRSGELGPGPFTGARLDSIPTDRATVTWENQPALASLVPVRSDGWTAVIIENLHPVSVQRLYGILATAAVALFTLCFFVAVQRETAYESRLAIDQQRLRSLNEALERQATTDSLTGLYNRLKFNALLMAEIDRANRYGVGFTLVMMDVDHFKRVNDTWGHHTGDIVLINIARLARDTMRSSDALARWGGEEFIALLPMTGVAGALYFSERVTQALTHFAFEPVPRVTCSFGVTEFIAGDSPESMTQRADAALYLAKERGRNRTEVNLATTR